MARTKTGTQRFEDQVLRVISRRVVLRAGAVLTGIGLCPACADGLDAFELVERAFKARLHGPAALTRALGMGRPKRGAATNASYRQFVARARPDAAFTELETRLSRSRPAGIAVLSARRGLVVTPDDVRRRHGPARWGDVRPELPLFYLTYPRPGGSVAFGFPRGEGSLASAVLNWGSWT